MSRSPSPPHSRSSSPIPPEMFNMIKAMSDNLDRLTARMAVLESRPTPPAPIPLGTNAEAGGPSKVALRVPLPDQRSAYDAARVAHHQVPPGVVPHHGTPVHAYNEQFPVPNSPMLRRNHYAPNRFNAFQGYQDEEMEDEGWQAEPPRGYQARRGREPEQDGIGKIKVKIPSFEGKCDPDVYMEWETKIEQIWSCHNFAEHKKVQLAALEFNGYALV